MSFFSSPLFFILIGLIAGILLGKVDTLFTNSLKNRKETGRIKDLESEVTTLRKQLESRPPSSTTPLASDMRLWTDKNGILNLELDNQPVNVPASATPEHRRRLITLLNQLRPWIESGPAAPAPRSAAPASAPQAVTPTPKPVAPAPAPVMPAEAKTGEAAIAPPPTTIVGQINAVLQARLAASPLAGKRIQLTESPNGGVRVYVGMKFYEGVDAVPDPEIIAAIRAAIAEWEKKVG
jgi:hypothetical protein